MNANVKTRGQRIWDEVKLVVPLGVITTIVLVVITMVVYLGFVMNILGEYEAMTPEVRSLITADAVDQFAMIVGNLCYGFLMVIIFRVAKITTPLKGAVMGAVLAFLSDYYYALCLFAMTKNMFTWTSITIDALTYTVVSFVCGAGLAWVLGRIEKKRQSKLQVGGDLHDTSRSHLQTKNNS